MQYSYAAQYETREEKIIKYLPLVKLIASRIFINKTSNVDNEDLISYGIIGLIDAIDRYDPSKGVKFETYASLRIKGAIIDELRKLNWMPRTAVSKISKLNEVKDNLKVRLGREPNDKEIAEGLDISVEDLRKAENYINYMSIISLDEVILQSDEEISLYTMLEDDKSPRPENMLEDKEMISMLKKAIDMLNEKDRMILTLYYYERLTLKEIGSVLNITESRVCQLHSRAILRLRENLRKLDYINT